jgi:2-hydroxychromene-2-carboxylate isomerase
MWEQGRKMDDPEVIRATITEAGLDAAHLLAWVQEQPVKDALAQSTQAAVDRGIFGCPTFFVGDDMFFGKDRLAQVEEALA